MGVNAQTSVPKFTSGDVLTAANTNLLSNGIPVFSGTATRNDSFGGTGEKVLAEGQFAYLEDSNTTEFYDGAAWQPVGALVLIASQAPAGATTLTFTNCFSATYNSYVIVGNGFTCSSAGADIYLTISGSAGSTYNWAGFYMNYAATTLNGYRLSGSGSGFNLGLGSTVINGFTASLRNPFAAAATTFSSQYASGGSLNTNGYSMISNGYDSNTSSSPSCTFTVGGASTFTGGTIKIYGLVN